MLVADSDILTHPMAESWAELVHLLQKKDDYSYIISASSSFGKNVLPRVAAILDVSPITDVIEISEPHLFVRFISKKISSIFFLKFWGALVIRFCCFFLGQN